MHGCELRNRDLSAKIIFIAKCEDDFTINLASSRVLEKCGFVLVAENPFGKSYAKALKIDMNLFNSSFNL